MTELQQIVDDYAAAMKNVDSTNPVDPKKKGKYRPGIGPLEEADAVRRATEYLKNDPRYERAAPISYPGSQLKCDLVLPGEWAIEFKLVRPFGDNGKEAEHWSDNVLHPYPGNRSSVGDCLKLKTSGFSERKAVIVFGFEHTPPVIHLETVIQAFELIAERIAEVRLGSRCFSEFKGLVHPFHQQGKIYGWEVL